MCHSGYISAEQAMAARPCSVRAAPTPFDGRILHPALTQSRLCRWRRARQPCIIVSIRSSNQSRTDCMHAACASSYFAHCALSFCDGKPSDAGSYTRSRMNNALPKSRGHYRLGEWEDKYERQFADRSLSGSIFRANSSRDATPRSTEQGHP